MLRPPDMRLVTALASKGATLTAALRKINMGPSGRETALQQLTTRDVVQIPDLFESSSGFVLPKDPWENGSQKTIYQRLVEEIHHAGRHEAPHNGNSHHDKAFSTDKDGIFQIDAGGLFKAWHKTTARAAGDGLADSRDGNGHLIVNDRDSRWQFAQQRGEAPMYTAIHERIEEFFQMKIQGKRYNHYRDMTNWKPFHHDAAGLDKDTGKGKGGKGNGGGKGGGKGDKPPMCEVQNMTVGVSFGEARQAAFEWAGAREKKCNSFPEHLRSPAVNPGSHKNVVLSLTLPDSSTYTFGRDVNLLWKHGILAEKPPSGKAGGRIDVEEGRISIIAWGWVDQYDELDEYLNDTNSQRMPQREDRANGWDGKDKDGRSRAGMHIEGGRGGGWCSGGRVGYDGCGGGGGRSQVCFDWLRGRCTRGSSCRFDHEDCGAGGGDRNVGGGDRHGGLDVRGRGGLEERERNKQGNDRSRSPCRDRQDRGGESNGDCHRKEERSGLGGGEWGGSERRRDDRDRHIRYGSSAGLAIGIELIDPGEAARREARAVKFGTQLPEAGGHGGNHRG